jgi:hypothetical protein
LAEVRSLGRRSTGSGRAGRLDLYDRLLGDISERGGIAARILEDETSTYLPAHGLRRWVRAAESVVPDLIFQDTRTGSIVIVDVKGTGIGEFVRPAVSERHEAWGPLIDTTPSTTEPLAVMLVGSYRRGTPIKATLADVDILKVPQDFDDDWVIKVRTSGTRSPDVDPDIEHDFGTPRRPAVTSKRVRVRVTEVAPRNRGVLLSVGDWAAATIDDSAGDGQPTAE